MRELIFSDGTTIGCESFVENVALGRLYLTVFTPTMIDALTLFSDASKLEVLEFEGEIASGYSTLSNIGVSFRLGGFDIILRKSSEVQNA